MRWQVFRHSAYRTPWRNKPDQKSAGRFHRVGGLTVQYLSCHPMGPAAEMLRHHLRGGGDPDDLVLNLWTAVVEVETCARVHFDNCEADWSISPELLVGDNYVPTQDLADRVYDNGFRAMLVPSAALPGTDSVILFDRRAGVDYLATPFTEVEFPTGHLSDGAHAPSELILQGHVRQFGDPHRGLRSWRDTGELLVFHDPAGAVNRFSRVPPPS